MNFVSYLWFLARPTLYPEMFRRLAYSLTHPRLPRAQRELWKVQSAEWSAPEACSLKNVARDLEMDSPLKKVSELHPEDWASAEKAVADCVAQMGGAAGAVDLLYNASLRLQVERVVETGVAFGWSRGRTFGYSILRSTLRPGGLLISDDIHDDLAFRDFCSKVGCEPWVLQGRDRSYVGVLRKPGGSEPAKLHGDLSAGFRSASLGSKLGNPRRRPRGDRWRLGGATLSMGGLGKNLGLTKREASEPSE